MALRYGTPTDLAELLAAVRARLVTATGLPARLVLVTLAADADLAGHPPANTFLAVKPLRFPGVAGITAGGAGRAYAGQLLASLWHRRAADQHLRDVEYLIGDQAGILSLWLKVLGALELWTPARTADADAGLTIQPMRNDPGFDVSPRQAPGGWGRLDSTWEVKFVHRTS